MFGNHLLARLRAVTLAALLRCLYRREDGDSSLGTVTGPPGVRDEVRTPAHKALRDLLFLSYFQTLLGK